MAFHHNATYMLPSLTFPFHFFYSYECVPLTIFYHLYFRRISYILSMLHQGSVERIQSKECYFKFTHTFLAFFIVFHQKICVLSFSFLLFFDEVSKLRNKISTNQKPEDFVRGTVYAQSLPLDVKKSLQQIYSKYF